MRRSSLQGSDLLPAVQVLSTADDAPTEALLLLVSVASVQSLQVWSTTIMSAGSLVPLAVVPVQGFFAVVTVAPVSSALIAWSRDSSVRSSQFSATM